MNLTSQTELLVMLAHRDPRIWEILHPHTPILSEGTRQVIASIIIKAVAKKLKDKETAGELYDAGKKIFTQGKKMMDYDLDDLGAPFHLHFHSPWDLSSFFFPVPRPNWLLDLLNKISANPTIIGFNSNDASLNPQPLPPGPPEELYFGAILILLSDAISSKEIAVKIKKTGSDLLKSNPDFSDKNFERENKTKGYR